MTAGKVVDELRGLGLVEESEAETQGETRGSMGRPPRLVRPSAERQLRMIELGVRRTVVQAVNLGGQVVGEPIGFDTPRALAAFERSLAGALARLPGETAVLVSVPGVLDGDGERVLLSPNLRWTEGRDALSRIAGVAGSPVCAVQEIQALALGHQAAGEAPESFVLVDFGDGVGGAVMTGGELFHSALPLCGEVGHTAVHANERPCSCGAVGCLETLVSRRGLLESFRDQTGRGDAAWDDLVTHVLDRGIEGWLMRSIDAAAVVIGGAMNLIGMQEVVLTGDLPSLHPAIVPAFAERIARHSLLGRIGGVNCVGAPRRRALGLIAAAADRILLPEPGLVGGTRQRLPSVG